MACVANVVFVWVPYGCSGFLPEMWDFVGEMETLMFEWVRLPVIDLMSCPERIENI